RVAPARVLQVADAQAAEQADRGAVGAARVAGQEGELEVAPGEAQRLGVGRGGQHELDPVGQGVHQGRHVVDVGRVEVGDVFVHDEQVRRLGRAHGGQQQQDGDGGPLAARVGGVPVGAPALPGPVGDQHVDPV